jgi:hypothetical protein
MCSIDSIIKQTINKHTWIRDLPHGTAITPATDIRSAVEFICCYCFSKIMLSFIFLTYKSLRSYLQFIPNIRVHSQPKIQINVQALSTKTVVSLSCPTFQNIRATYHTYRIKRFIQFDNKNNLQIHNWMSICCVYVYKSRHQVESGMIQGLDTRRHMYVYMYVSIRGGPQTAPAPRPSLIYCAFPYT